MKPWRHSIIHPGHRFGSWLSLGEGEPIVSLVTYRTSPTFRCLCACGRIKSVRIQSLKSGISNSCGCLQENKNKKTTSARYGYKGVYKAGKNYIARVAWRNRSIYAGSHHTPEGAALKYDIKATELRGDRAVTNKKLGLL